MESSVLSFFTFHSLHLLSLDISVCLMEISTHSCFAIAHPQGSWLQSYHGHANDGGLPLKATLSPDGMFVISGMFGEFNVICGFSPSRRSVFLLLRTPGTSLTWRVNNRISLMLLNHKGSSNGTVHIWDRETGQQVAAHTAHKVACELVKFNPSSIMLASANKTLVCDPIFFVSLTC